MRTTSFNTLVNQVKSADWQAANRTFGDIMTQKVADRLQQERAQAFKEGSLKEAAPARKAPDAVVDARTVRCMVCHKGFKSTVNEPSCKFCGAGYEDMED